MRGTPSQDRTYVVRGEGDAEIGRYAWGITPKRRGMPQRRLSPSSVRIHECMHMYSVNINIYTPSVLNVFLESVIYYIYIYYYIYIDIF